MRLRSRQYVGARQQFALLDQALWDQAISASYRSICIHGSQNCGKTALLAAWTLAYREEHPSCHVVAHFAGASPKCPSLETSINRLIEDIVAHFGLGDIGASNDKEKKPLLDLADLRSRFVDVIHSASQRGDLLIVCDGFETLPSVSLQGTKEDDLRSWIPRTLPDGVSILPHKNSFLLHTYSQFPLHQYQNSFIRGADLRELSTRGEVNLFI
jgi:hypothetical protein